MFTLKTLKGTEKRHFTCYACKTSIEIATVEEIEEKYGTKIELDDEGGAIDSLFQTPDDENISLIHTKGFIFRMLGCVCLCKECGSFATLTDKDVSYQE